MAPSAMGRRVKRLREAKGLSQRGLAAKAKASQSLIHQLETGKVQDIRSQVVVKLAKALGVPVTELLGGG
jgi:transcriptional regulator with XRE-family HTH domain